MDDDTAQAAAIDAMAARVQNGGGGLMRLGVQHELDTQMTAAIELSTVRPAPSLLIDLAFVARTFFLNGICLELTDALALRCVCIDLSTTPHKSTHAWLREVLKPYGLCRGLDGRPHGTMRLKEEYRRLNATALHSFEM